jgi:poly(hydroxyalkanoate) depolymerase family esterase
MNPHLTGLMRSAVHLTRGGRLVEATAAIQRALRGEAEPPSFGAAPTARGRADAIDVIDVEARELLPERAVRSQAQADSTEPAQAARAERWTRGSFTHGGRAVGYRLFVPARAPGDASTPRPLVVMLHGCTQDADDFAAGTRMNEHARECGAIVLYPEQTQRAHGQKCWNWFKTPHQQRGRGEPALLAALTERIASEEQADRTRIYVAGLSAGGAMADILGQCYPDVYAAVGVHSGLPRGVANDVMSALSAMRSGPAGAERETAASARPPTIVLHGDADTTVHARNGMAIVDGAVPGAVSEGRSDAGRRFTRTLYAASQTHGEAEHWRLHAAGHAWSGGNAGGSYTQPDGVDASREMLRFFLAHRLGDTAGH